VVADSLPIATPEDIMTFDDSHVPNGKYTYKATPFSALGEPGTPAQVDVIVK